MPLKRKSMKVLDHERRVLVEMYLQRAIPVDQYEDRPLELQSFADEWNLATKRNNTPQEILHYMRNQRKCGLWVKLGECAVPVPSRVQLTPEEQDFLVALVTENLTVRALGSDELAYDQNIADFIAREFADFSGRIVPSHQLISHITALRKRGLLPKVADNCRDDDNDFGDAGSVVV